MKKSGSAGKVLAVMLVSTCLLSGCGHSTDTPQAGYEKFSSLVGLSVEKVETALDQPLEFQEEKYDSKIYTDDAAVTYFFLTKAEVLYRMDYKELDEETALKLAKDSCEAIEKQYNTTSFLVTDKISKLQSVDDMKEKLSAVQYSEAYRVAYPKEMAKKIEQYKETEEGKVTLSVDLGTDRFMDQGTYSVSITQTSLDLNNTSK